jgi:antitoxin component YwqK of YwqJK toxin-antitoxin module
MDLYIVNLNQETKTYMGIEDIPFELSEDNLINLSKNNFVSFFSEAGEVHITLSKNNETIYKAVYQNPEPLEADGFISISHYNKEHKLNSSVKNVPSLINTFKNEKLYHKNGININPKSKDIFKDDYGEYTLLKNLQKDLNLKEVRCYTDGFRQYIENNEDIQWVLNKELCSPANDIPTVVEYNEDGSLRSESYYINGQLHRDEAPAIIEYFNQSIFSEGYYVNGEAHNEDGPAIIRYYNNGCIRYESYYINGKLNREDGPAQIRYNEDGSIQKEKYYFNGKLHKEDSPAIIYYNKTGSIGSELYYINGELQNSF